MPRTKLTKTTSNSVSRISPNTSNSGNTIISANESGEIAVSLPGLGDFSIDQIDQFVPATNRENNQVTDLLNPQITDRLSDGDKADRMRVYEEGINAEQVKQKGFKYIGEQFKTEQARNQTVGEFVEVGTSIEKVKGAVIDYFTQIESNRDKGAKYIAAQMTANTSIATLPETQATLDEQLKQAQMRREKTTLKSQREMMELELERQRLGNYAQLPQNQV